MNQKTSDKLRENIQAVAKLKRIPYSELCMNAGLHYDTLRKFLKGDADMTVTKVEQLADALGFTVVGLINWKHK